MRLLVVEDNADFVASIEAAARTIPNVEVVWAASRDSALEKLAAEHFDLVILDRRVPSADGVLDDDANHGWRVFQFAQECCGGTPVWFLTGTEEIDFATEMNNDYGRAGDLHGRDQLESMYLVFWKRKISDCVRRIREFAAQRDEVARIAIRVEQELNLSPAERCIIQAFGRRYHGTAVDLVSLNGGLSRSRVLKAVVRDGNNSALLTAAAKISTLKEINDEAVRYRNEISRLSAGGFPQLTTTIEVGAGNHGGLFYGMVGDVTETLFQRLSSGHAGVANVPAELHRVEAPWYRAKTQQNVTVAQIRRRVIGDAALHEIRNELDGIDIRQLEALSVRVSNCTQHGDLHAANVVFAGGGQAMLIDFADAGPSYATIDPVTLELGTIFHAQHTTLPVGWPTEEHIASWVDPNQFSNGCVFAQFVMACRQWANEEAGSPEEVVAVAYAYAVRQLKYRDTNKAFARALIRACIQRLVR